MADDPRRLKLRLTDSEFCWRGPSGTKSKTVCTTYPRVYWHGSEPRRALVVNLIRSETYPPGNPRSSNSMLGCSGPSEVLEEFSCREDAGREDLKSGPVGIWPGIGKRVDKGRDVPFLCDDEVAYV